MTPRCNLYHKWCVFFGKVHNLLSRWSQCEIRECCFLPWVNSYLSIPEDKRCWLLWIVMSWGFNSHMFIWKGNLFLWSCVVGIFPKRHEKKYLWISGNQEQNQINHSPKLFLGGPMSYWTYFQELGWLRECIIVKTLPAWMITQNDVLWVLCPSSSPLSLVIVTVLHLQGCLWILWVCFRIFLNHVGFVCLLSLMSIYPP